MKKIFICDDSFEFYDFWKKFHSHVKDQTESEISKIPYQKNVELVISVYNRIQREELAKYNAEFFYLNMCIEFDTEQNSVLFLLEWS